jgi:anti-sigma factor RsiW
MNMPGHLANDVLIRALDDELAPKEAALVESHLSGCEECNRRSAGFRSLSGHIESFVASEPESRVAEREVLVRKLESQAPRVLVRPRSSKLTRTIGWAMALAASLAVIAILSPRSNRPAKPTSVAIAQVQSGTVEVDGESFISLPYSNPDLPAAAAHIVQMQVPVASLTAAGIVFEPVSNGAPGSDRSVLADVLLGMDGQPLGVHVLSFD